MLLLLSYLYLAIPLAIFFTTWLRMPYSLLLLCAIIFPGYILSKDIKNRRIAMRPTITGIVIAVLALMWVYYSGSGGFSFQNGDWSKHNAVLGDLIQYDWPVRYKIENIGPTYLDYYLGWYTVPAFIGKLTHSLTNAFLTQYIWTVAGILLCMRWLKTITKKSSMFLYGFFMMFATADSLGILILKNTNLLNFITPLEHWSTHEYSSFTTLLYWVPGQGIGVWIVMCALIYMLQQKHAQSFSMWFALLMFWSPLGFIGMIPFGIYLLFLQIKKGAQNTDFLVHFIPSLFILFFFFLYYKANIFGTLYSQNFRGIWLADSPLMWGRFAVFLFSELLLPLFLIFLLRTYLGAPLKTLFYIAAPTLIFLPFFHYGLLNDLVMRGSIPSLFVIFLCSYTLLSSKKVRTKHLYIWLTLIIYFLLGAITPITEINRSLKSGKNVGIPIHIPQVGDAFTSQQYQGFGDSFMSKEILKK